MSAAAPTAMQQGLQSCETCGLLSRPAPGEEEGRCPRCAQQIPGRWPAQFEGQITSRPFLPHKNSETWSSRLFTITGH